MERGAAAILLCTATLASCRSEPPNDTRQAPAAALVVGSERVPLYSLHNAGEYELRIALPRSYDDTTRRYPVLYVLDGNALFGLATDLARLLSLDRRFPEMIVVGIAYPTSAQPGGSVLQRRLADFTPTNIPQEDSLQGVHSLPLTQRSGNAAAFARALLSEIIPAIEQRYRVDSARRTLWGYSLGGLFALGVFLEHPRAFRSYLITSPSLWWDDGRYFKRLEAVASDAALGPATLFLSAGAVEQRADPWAAMVSNVERLAAALQRRGEPGLELHSVIFPDETHLSVPAASLGRGLRLLLLARDPVAPT